MPWERADPDTMPGGLAKALTRALERRNGVSNTPCTYSVDRSLPLEFWSARDPETGARLTAYYRPASKKKLLVISFWQGPL